MNVPAKGGAVEVEAAVVSLKKESHALVGKENHGIETEAETVSEEMKSVPGVVTGTAAGSDLAKEAEGTSNVFFCYFEVSIAKFMCFMIPIAE